LKIFRKIKEYLDCIVLLFFLKIINFFVDIEKLNEKLENINNMTKDGLSDIRRIRKLINQS